MTAEITATQSERTPAITLPYSNFVRNDAPAIVDIMTTGMPSQRWKLPQNRDASKCPFDECRRLSSMRLASRITSSLVLEGACSRVPGLAIGGEIVVEDAIPNNHRI